MPVSESDLQAVVDRLRAAAPDATLVLFGSHARGEAREDSDLDILVIETEARGRRAEMVRLTRALRGLGVPVDIVVVSAADYAEWSGEPGTVMHEAAVGGRVLHAAPQAC